MSWICLCFCLDWLLLSLQLSVKNQTLKYINLKHSNVHPYPCILFSHVLWKCIQILCSVKLPHSQFQLKNSILYDNFLYNSESSLPLVRNYDGYCTNADFNTSNLFLFIKKMCLNLYNWMKQSVSNKKYCFSFLLWQKASPPLNHRRGKHLLQIILFSNKKLFQKDDSYFPKETTLCQN